MSASTGTTDCKTFSKMQQLKRVFTEYFELQYTVNWL